MSRRAGRQSQGPHPDKHAATGAVTPQQRASSLTSQSDVLTLQHAVGNRAVDTLLGPTGPISSSRSTAIPRHVRSVLAGGGGRTLDADLRLAMEERFGRDFTRVRVYTDAAATRSADALGAQAYTVGQDIVFGTGQFEPRSVEGRRLLAHELTHVVQQSRGGTTTNATASEAEAARTAQNTSHVASPLPVMSAAPVGIQCQLYDRGATEQRLKELGKKINAKEKEFGEIGGDLESDPEYRDMRAEYFALHNQLKQSQSSGTREIFGASKPLGKVTVSGVTIDPQAPPRKPSPPPSKGERTLPLQISPFGKPVTLIDADIVDPVRRHRVHNLKVDIKAIHDQTQAARWAWDQALSEWKIIRKTADLFAGATPPSFSVLESIHNIANQAHQSLEKGDLDEADRLVAKAQRSIVNARSAWQRYRIKNIGGAESLKTTLEYTRDASFLTLAILAPGAGAAGTLIAAGAPIAAEVGGVAIQVALGDEVDWAQAGVNVAISLLLSRFGPAATDAVMKGVVAKIGTHTVARDVILKIIKNEIMHAGSIALGAVARAALAALRGQRVTWKSVCEEMLAQLASPSGHIAVLVSTRAQMAAAKPGARPSAEPTAQTPPPPRPPGPAKATSSREPAPSPGTAPSRSPAATAATASQPAAGQAPSSPASVSTGTAAKPGTPPTRAKRRTPQQMAAARVAERKAAERTLAEARAASKRASEEAALAEKNVETAKRAAERASKKATAPARSKKAGERARAAENQAKANLRAAERAATIAKRGSDTAGKRAGKAAQTAAAKQHTERVATQRAAAAGGRPLPATTFVGFGKRRRQELIAFWEQKKRRARTDARREQYQDYIDRIKKRQRPHWRQSEKEMEFFYKGMGGTAQAGFKHGRRSKPKYDKEKKKWEHEPNSAVPDMTYSAAMIEVKNYKIQNKAGLIRTLVKQVERRRETGPATVKHQAIILDLRGQQADLREINSLVRDVSKATQVPLDYIQVLTW